MKATIDTSYPGLSSITANVTSSAVAPLPLRRLIVGVCSLFLFMSILLHSIVQELDEERKQSAQQAMFGLPPHRSSSKSRGLRKKQLQEQQSDRHLQLNEPNEALHAKKYDHRRSESVRQQFEKDHPPDDLPRIRAHVAKLHTPHKFAPHVIANYDVRNCPDQPPDNYPVAWNTLEVLRNWNPDDVEEVDWPREIYQGLCVFDWERDLSKAEAYRNAELPFVVQNHPDLLRASERWSTPNYLHELVGAEPQRNEHSLNNHLMFWRVHHLSVIPKGWEKPTDEIELKFSDWYAKATSLQSQPNQTAKEHWYFRLNGYYSNGHAPEAHEYLYDELPIFVPKPDNFFMVEPREERGINCRFGMKGIIAENHFDMARNFIVVLGGQRRYILAHPKECENMELYEVSHPSGRHSSVDWSTRLTDNAALEEFRLKHAKFSKAQVNEVVLQAGDALYLPTSWFHYIVNLNVNYQCNARSGTSYEYMRSIKTCGQMT